MLFFDKGNGSLAVCQGNSLIVGLWNAAKDVAAILETLIIYLWMGGMVTLLQCVSLLRFKFTSKKQKVNGFAATAIPLSAPHCLFESKEKFSTSFLSAQTEPFPQLNIAQ